MMKIYFVMVFSTYALFISLSFLSVYVVPLRIIVEHFSYAMLEAGCLFSMLNPFLLRKISEKSESDSTFPKQRYNGIPSESSSSSLNSISTLLRDNQSSSTYDTVSFPLNEEISSSPSLNTISFGSSVGDANLAPNKGRRRSSLYSKMKHLIVYNDLNTDVVV